MSEEFNGSTVTTLAGDGMVQFRSDGPAWQAWYASGLTGSGAAQHINDPVREREYFDIPNLTLSGGSFVMTAIKDNVHTATNQPYSSGMATTNPSFNFQYGYVEARCKCSGVGGTWPAFWLIPQDYSWPPEVDIFEQFGTVTVPKATTFLNAGGVGSVNLQSAGVDIVAGYQTLAVKWTATTLTFYVNGTQYAQETNVNAVPQKPMYVVFDLAIDSNQTINDAGMPTTFLVDYVRVWQ
jgi:beta-glucanase (GH16 family)